MAILKINNSIKVSRKTLKSIFLLFGALLTLTLGFTKGVHAQGIIGLSPDAPPPYSMREFGINLSTSDVEINNDDISVGSGEFPTKLTLTRTYNSIGYPVKNLNSMSGQNQYTGFGQGSSNNLIAYFTAIRCSSSNNSRFISLTAVVFGKAHHFSGGGCTDPGPSTFVSNDDDGTTMRIVDPSLSVWTYELTTLEGIKVKYTDDSGYQYDSIGGRYATYAEFPNGDFIGFNYTSSPSVSGTVRLATVYNSRGYGLSFSYSARAAYFSGITLTDSSLITSVTSFKQTSAGRTNISSVYYTYDSTNFFVASFQNAAGKIYRYTYDLGRPIGIFYPNNTTSQPSLSIAYLDSTSQVTTTNTANGPGIFYLAGSGDNVRDVNWTTPRSVTDALGNITLFNFSDPVDPQPLSVTIIRPSGTSNFYTTVYCDTSPACMLAPYYSKNPTTYIDGLNNLWQFKYDNHGRPVSTKMPSGILKSQTRDAIGNIIELRVKAADSSSAADIVSSAGYEVCNNNNYRYCAKPIFTINASGARWDYQYSITSGQIVASLAPADSNGTRAVTRYSYATSSYAAVAMPYLFQDTYFALLVTKDTCLSSTVTGNVVDFTFVCGAGSRSRETYNYISSTPSNRSSSELSTLVTDADQAASTKTFSYDVTGNITSVTDALNHNSFTIFDILRRKVFEIGPDPDGAGPLPRLIVHHVYDDNDNEIRTEIGTGNQLDGSDFVIIHFKRNTYDLNDKLVKIEEVTP